MGKQTILVIAAHPDDETIGMGATIAKLAKQGHEVYVLVMADGESSRPVLPVDDSFAARAEITLIRNERISQRREQCRKACDALGVHRVWLQGYKDQRLDTYSMLELATDVGVVVNSVNPTIVYTHNPHDLNQDHVAVHRATMIACRPQPGQCVKTLYTYEVPETTNWAFGQWGQWQPNVFVDVTGTLTKKFDAMNCYTSELRPWPHPRSVTALKDSASRWGAMVGVVAAEAFQCVWKVE